LTDKYDRVGVLAKRNKLGQYRDTTFKLLPSCLLYYRE
jgi:hypothetical protein